MAKNELDRSQQTREKEEEPLRWKRPSVLPEPDDRPGYKHRWVRVALNGKPDPRNISARIREGWEPCKAKDYPEIDVAFVEHQQFKDNIVIGGVMLCITPEELVKQRNDYFQQQAAQQIVAVDNNLMRENDPRMPLFNDRKSKVTFGKGN